MTSEQIAEWRRVDEHLREHRDGVVAATRDLIPPARDVLGMALHENGLRRLLDEREALLEALKGVEWCGDSFQGFAAVCPDCVAQKGKPHESGCALADAIAKAESP